MVDMCKLNVFVVPVWLKINAWPYEHVLKINHPFNNTIHVKYYKGTSNKTDKKYPAKKKIPAKKNIGKMQCNLFNCQKYQAVTHKIFIHTFKLRFHSKASTWQEYKNVLVSRQMPLEYY